jgi:hypothetical protein
VIRSRSLVAGAAILFGVVVAHVLDGFAEVSEEGHHLEAVAHRHGWSFSPWIATALVVIGVVVLARRLPPGLNPLLVALPFFAFAVQEATERIGGGESLPFESSSLKHIALGVLLQLPVALFIYLLVRVALIVVRRLAGAFALPAPDEKDTRGRFGERRGYAPKISALARGSPTRGPPLFVAV